MGNGADEAPPRCQVTPPQPKDKGGAEAPSQSYPRVYKSLQERGGDLHRLQLNRKRQLPQDGPAAAQLRWTTYSGGVLHLLHRKAHDIKEPCGVSTLSTRSKELSPSSSYWRTNKTRFSPNRSPDLVRISASAPARALLSFILTDPPPSPHDRPWSMRTTDAG